MPFSCAASSALQIWRRMGSARSGAIAPSLLSTRPSEWPSRYSMTKNTRPSGIWPKSVTSQMNWLPILDAARASSRKRSMAPAVWATSARNTLMATRFSSCTCSAA